MIASELMVGYGVVDRYMARRSQKSKSPELFDNEGNARWITIGAEPGADGKKHGGHPVKISDDGKMLTGKFAGQTLGQAFGGKDHPQDNSGRSWLTDEQRMEAFRKRNEEIENSVKKVSVRPLAELLSDIREKGKELEHNRDSQEYDEVYRDFHQQVRLAQRSLKPEDEQLLTKVFSDWFPTPNDYEEDKVVDLEHWKKANPEPRNVDLSKSEPKPEAKQPDQPPSDGVPRVTQDQIGDGQNGTYDQMHAGLASEFVQSRIAQGMKTGKFAGKTLGEAFGGGKSPEQTTGAEGKSPELSSSDDDAYFKGDKGRRTGKKQMLHGGEFEELEMLEGPHKGQIKVVPTRKQEQENVARNKREHAEMQEGFSRLNQSKQPAPNITMDTRSNDSAKPNDQMGLFGDVANVPQGVKSLSPGGESKGKQQSLFDTKGDPDQILMFDDGVTPEDRLMKPEQFSAVRDRAAELVRYWGLSAEGLGERVCIERYGSDHWKNQIRDNLGRWTKEGIPEVKYSQLDKNSLAKNLIKLASHLKGQEAVNRDTGWKIKIDSRAIDKIAGRGDPSSYSILVLPKLLESAMPISLNEKPKSQDQELIAFHQFGNPVIIHGKMHAAKITVKETRQHGFRAYSVHAVEIEKGTSQMPTVQKTGLTSTVDVPSAISIDSEISKVKPTDKEKYSAPSEAQREAGNYPKKHIRLHGLDISIETAKGERRRPEWPPMPCDYGYIRETVGKDKDHVDVFVGPNRKSELVVVVDQVNQDGKFDEHKVLLGFSNKESAIKQYKLAYTSGWKVGPVTVMTIAQFKAWLKVGSQNRPVEKQVSRYSSRNFTVMSA